MACFSWYKFLEFNYEISVIMNNLKKDWLFTLYKYCVKIDWNSAWDIVFCSKVYKTEVLLPVLQSVARRLGQGELYEGIAMETDPLVMPKGASEIEIKSKQVCFISLFYEKLINILNVNTYPVVNEPEWWE